MGFSIGRKDVTVKTIHFPIAAYALTHGVPLPTVDRDFALLQRAGVPLALAPI